jgi:hypothetical protein
MLATPAFPMGPDVGTDDVAAPRFITFRTDATSEELLVAGATLVESYGTFAIARGPASAMTALRAGGRYALEMPRAQLLDLLGGPVDARDLARPSAWRIDAAGNALAVAHFHGPIKQEWRDAFDALGAAVLRYIPEQSFLVRGSPEALDRLSSLPYVDGVGEYRAEWKVRPALFARTDVVDVHIVLFPGEGAAGVVAWLAHAGVSTSPGTGTASGIAGAYRAGDIEWVRARIPADLLSRLASLPSVEFIDPVRTPRPLNAQTAYVLQTNRTFLNGTPDYRYWRNGLDARGQVIAFADTGLDYDGPPFRHSTSSITLGDLFNATDANRRKVVRYVNMGVLTGQLTWPGGGGPWDPYSIMDCAFGHGTGVASTLGGNDNGLGTSPNDGVALAAKLYMQDIGGFFGGIEACPNEGLLYLPSSYDDLFGPPGLVYNDPVAPVRVHSNSWGADVNEYDLQARMIDSFVWSHPDLVVVFAAGNAGSGAATIGTPATAKDILAVGGAYNPDSSVTGGPNDLASQSSRGPASDGRIKPTFVTIFDGDSAMSDGDPTSGLGNGDAHWLGTSYSTPSAAGAAAIVRQYFVDGWYPASRPVAANSMSPSAALVRAVLIASGAQMTGGGTVVRAGEDRWPNNEQGFGRILLANVLPIATAGDTFRTQVVDSQDGLLTGDEATTTFHLSSPGRLRIALAWSDYPGTLGATKALVNDLDLEVTAPDGTVYRGNNFGTFAQGASIPGGVFDATNVEEAVFLKSASAGDWTVRIIGANVPIGPQRFALVATGNLDPAYGRVSLDRISYDESADVGITVEDADASSVVVRMSSGLESGGEDVTLTRGGPDERWSGTIRTAFGSVAADGILQVRDQDTITAIYQDLSPPRLSTARARIEARGPTVSDVRVDAIDATGARVRWATDRSSTSEVRYGTDPADLAGTARDSALRTGHELVLDGLAADSLYYFDVVSAGRNGNETVDDDGGSHYRFRTGQWGDVLVVIGDLSFPDAREASYVAALGSRGWTSSLWRISKLGPPPLQFLQDRLAVIWQTGLEQYPPFNASERALVKAYLDGGGRLLVSSHDAAWALISPDSPFSSPTAAAWVRGVLKASLDCDPVTIAETRGVTGDPISGPYTGGLPYAPHRDGGAEDELTTLSAGGTTSVVWTDGNQVLGCSPDNRPNGLRWVSIMNNGTAGTGVWGGAPSRLAYFAFELTGLDASSADLNVGSAARADVIDRTLRWLIGISTSSLDRDHPDVVITSPSGGSFTGPTISIAWTATPFGPGIGIASISIEVTADDGRTWESLATLGGSETSYAWDISGRPNGDRYGLRVTAEDDGAPSLRGGALTPAFRIARPSGDAAGPILWAGSVQVDPRPPGAGSPTAFGATADDRLRGGSAIAGAELFIQSTMPTPSDAGSGLPMTAADGAFDETVETLRWSGALGTPPGSTCVWIHALDASGNWGPYASSCFLVIFVGPDTIAPAAADVDTVRATNAAQDLSIGWAAAWDEGLYGGTVAYRVSRSTSPRGPFADVSGLLLADGSARYEFVDAGRAADASDYFYRVETLDEANNTGTPAALAAKVRIGFSAGLNLLGMPVVLTNATLESLTAGAPWSDAWTYDACAGPTAWSSALPSDPATFSVPLGRGLWLNASGDGFITALGVLPATGQVRLCAGWNLVALPGFAAGMAVRALKDATGASEVVGFDSAGPYYVQSLEDAEVLAPGRGYWVRVPATVDWIVAGW